MADIQRIQPAGLSDVRGFGFSQVVTATGSKQIYISGQVASDANQNLVGHDDLKSQTRQVMENLGTALTSADATYGDIVKLTIFVVGYEPHMRGEILEIRNEFIDPHRGPASTFIGVAALVHEAFLIEIEAIAVVD